MKIRREFTAQALKVPEDVIELLGDSPEPGESEWDFRFRVAVAIFVATKPAIETPPGLTDQAALAAIAKENGSNTGLRLIGLDLVMRISSTQFSTGEEDAKGNQEASFCRKFCATANGAEAEKLLRRFIANSMPKLVSLRLAIQRQKKAQMEAQTKANYEAVRADLAQKAAKYEAELKAKEEAKVRAAEYARLHPSYFMGWEELVSRLGSSGIYPEGGENEVQLRRRAFIRLFEEAGKLPTPKERLEQGLLALEILTRVNVNRLPPIGKQTWEQFCSYDRPRFELEEMAENWGQHLPSTRPLLQPAREAEAAERERQRAEKAEAAKVAEAEQSAKDEAERAAIRAERQARRNAKSGKKKVGKAKKEKQRSRQTAAA